MCYLNLDLWFIMFIRNYLILTYQIKSLGVGIALGLSARIHINLLQLI